MKPIGNMMVPINAPKKFIFLLPWLILRAEPSGETEDNGTDLHPAKPEDRDENGVDSDYPHHLLVWGKIAIAVNVADKTFYQGTVTP